MSDKTGVDWADSSWTVTSGCSKVSAGCVNCYAIKAAWRMSHNPNPKVSAAFSGTVEKDASGRLDWSGTIRCLDDRLGWPVKWGKPRRIFVDSLADLFHPDVPFEFIEAVYGVMRREDRHTYQLLTKRPSIAAEFFSEHRDKFNYALPHVWFGVTVESQQWTSRIPTLLSLPVCHRWLSIEPLLSPVQLEPEWLEDSAGLDWIVIGAETGKGARGLARHWVTDLIDQCKAAGVPVFVKRNIPNYWLEGYGVSYLQELPASMEAQNG